MIAVGDVIVESLYSGRTRRYKVTAVVDEFIKTRELRLDGLGPLRVLSQRELDRCPWLRVSREPVTERKATYDGYVSSPCGHDGWQAGCANCERQELLALQYLGDV